MAAKPPAFKIPKLPAQAADLLYSLRNTRLDLTRQAEAIEAQEAALREHLISTLPKGEASGVRGKLCSVYIENKEIVVVKDWDKLRPYIVKHSAWGLMNKAINQAALLEEIKTSKRKVPGVEAGFVPVLRVNKVG